MALDYCYAPQYEWEVPPHLRHKLPEYSQSQYQADIDEWLGVVEAIWFPNPEETNVLTEACAVHQTQESLESRFSSLVMKWRDETEDVSSLTQIISHPAYQAVIELGKKGEKVVPLILRDFAANSGYWSMALSALTGENPVSEKHIGDPKGIREDWVKWGKKLGYL